MPTAWRTDIAISGLTPSGRAAMLLPLVVCAGQTAPQADPTAEAKPPVGDRKGAADADNRAAAKIRKGDLEGALPKPLPDPTP
jgi:hypothetical protein